MTRVIQDSEDEFDDDDVEAPLPTSPTKNVLPETQKSTPMPSRDQGTGSTDSLRRNIEAAHRAHSQPDASNHAVLLPPSTHDSSVSLSEHASKRRKTTTDVSLDMSSGHRASMDESFGLPSVRKKPAKTYSRSKSVFSSPYLERTIVELEPQKSPTRAPGKTDQAWIAGTMREDYVQHEPLAMFPEPSSTVPNATLTQQRMLEEARAPLRTDIGLPEDLVLFHPQDSPVPYQPAKSSIPWSEYLRTPSGNTEPTASRQEASNHETLNAIPQSPHPSEDDARIQYELVSSNHPKRDTEVRIVIESPDIARRADVKNASPSPNTVRQSSPQADSDDELAVIGVRKEQYKPRPSRSRSIKAPDEETIDFSVRPERAGRRRTKRKSGRNDLDDPARACTPSKVQQICEMGFTPTITEKALLQSDGDMATAVDWLIANGMSADQQDELAPVQTTKQSPDDDVAVSSSLKFRPPSQKTGSITAQARKAKRRKTTLDLPEPTVEPDSALPPTDSSKEKKRGRGRPRKDEKALEVVAEESVIREADVVPPLGDLDEAQNNAGVANSANQKTKDGALQETMPHKPLATGIQEPIDQTDQQAGLVLPSTAEPPASTPPEKMTAAYIEAKKTREGKAKPANGSHSPLNKGKVPYRVGLSKRARIAPLLRVVKK
ncbi:hypothetical protein P154DRAFT_561421 [Amniculicola lignicola CBS 123094]|uniref:UBA domain-containing protein n=1 Tax=Amniculicola lignicola CBS 123094 TaxID=1392246 RepID=A0A6A5WN73_9PLEO|nr:hypothetical protein P154DRAFT_561421 [Amniculicola lignicola CBS 123094]